MFENNVDLRVPLRFLIRHWRWIAATAVFAAFATGIITLVRPRVYLAEATVIVSPSRTEIQFDNRIQTLADYELLGGTVTSRRDALTALVRSNEVVQAVLADIGDSLKPDERDPTWLREAISTETAGDLINIEFRYEDPEVAADVVNAWVVHYERHVNSVYSRSSIADNSSIVEQVEASRVAYNNAQTALEAYQEIDPLDSLQRELDAKIAVLENYQQARIAVQSRPVDRSQQILNGYYFELAQIEFWLADARGLRDQIASNTGSEAASLGNAMALISLQNRIYGGRQWQNTSTSTEEVNVAPVAPLTEPNLSLQFDLSSAEDMSVSVADADALVSALELRRTAAQNRVDTFLEGLQSPEEAVELERLNENIATLIEEINILQSQIEAATAQQRELTSDRDNSWETYQLLTSRQVEEQVANQTVSSEVRIGDRAFVPSEPVSRGLVINTLLAFVVGWIFASGILLLIAWWQDDGSQDRIRELAQNSDDKAPFPEQAPPPSGLPESMAP